MPKTKASASPIKRAKRARRTTVKGAVISGPGAAHAYVYQGDRPTHVLVPIEEYQELIKAEMAKSAVRKLNGKGGGWIDADALGMRLAGERIATARKAAGLTQKQLGSRLKVPQSQISRIERHPDHTTVRTLKRIAKALGVDVSALI